MKYGSIPTYSKFQSDSSVAFEFREHDIVLARMDGLLKHRQKTNDASLRFLYLSDLFFTADFWLKSYATNKNMCKGRQPAIYALFAACAEELCQYYGCTINGLPRELEFMWGRNLTGGGVYVDVVAGKAEYITRAEAAKYKLWFKGGRAYMMPWYRPTDANQKLEPAESKHAYTKEALTLHCLPAEDYGFFVLTMSRDLYMAKHRTCGLDGSPGFYHSSYVAGDPVACSGTMLIQKGEVKRIRLNSGHYQPHMNNLRALVMALRMWAVPLHGVIFEDFKGNPIGKSGSIEDVLEASSDLTKLNERRNGTVIDSKVAHGKRPTPDLSNSPDPRSWWGNRPYQKDVQPPGLRTL